MNLGNLSERCNLTIFIYVDDDANTFIDGVNGILVFLNSFLVLGAGQFSFFGGVFNELLIISNTSIKVINAFFQISLLEQEHIVDQVITISYIQIGVSYFTLKLLHIILVLAGTFCEIIFSCLLFVDQIFLEVLDGGNQIFYGTVCHHLKLG